MWRKNRRTYARDERFRWNWGRPAEGVDLNRNYGPDASFCKGGTSTDKRSDVCCGTHAFSEPEIAGIEEYINAHPEIAGGIDVHTYGDLVLRPYGLTRNPVDEPHGTKMKSVGDRMASGINAFDAYNPGRYKSIRAAQLYVASGTFMDSMYESHNHMPSITFKLRGGNFIVNPKLICITGREIFHGLQVFSEEVQNY